MNENPKIEWSLNSGKECLKFTFGEKLTTKEAEVAIEEWREAFKSKMNRSIILIWDCRKMKKYDGEAKDKWTDALKEMKSQIDSIWLISDSPFIRMAGSVMGMVSSLNVRSIKSEDELRIF